MYKFKTLIELVVFNYLKIALIGKSRIIKPRYASYGSVLKRIFCLFFVVVMFSGKLIAQKSISISKTIEYINDKFGSDYTIKVDYGSMVATYFENGEKYREDQVSIKELSADKVSYNSKTGMLLLNCKAPDGKCVTREFLGKRLYYNRVSFVLKSGGNSKEGLVKAFKHLIRSINEKNYESSEPFE